MSRNSENYDEFMGYLGMVHSIIQERDVSSVYVIGDWKLKSMQILYSDQSCLVFVRIIVMSYLILNIWVLIAVVLLSSVKRMGLPHGLINAYVRVRLMPVFLQLMLFMILRARTIFLCPFVLRLVLFPC